MSHLAWDRSEVMALAVISDGSPFLFLHKLLHKLRSQKSGEDRAVSLAGRLKPCRHGRAAALTLTDT